MRLHILCDLHLEFGPVEIPATNADVVILAGDMHVGTKGATWALQQFPTTPIIYLMGNHEFYHNALPTLTGTIQRGTAGTHLHLLENSAVEINGYTFLGCTLWSDFSIAADPEAAMRVAEERMNDYRIITNSNEKRALCARDTAEMHKESVVWLTDHLAECDPERTIVVTHHSPSQRSEAPYNSGSPLGPAFTSNLDALIERSGVPLWIHGHTHYNVDYRIGSTRVLSNQRGYPGEPCKGFDPGMVVEMKLFGGADRIPNQRGEI
jgi:predicted phosphodiesterase